MKKALSVLLIAVLLLTSVSALAATKKSGKYDPKYTMDTTGHVVLQSVPDRAISPNPGELDVNPVIPGESPTTGLPYDTDSLYQPMLIQISNERDRAKQKSAGVGARAPWGGQYADIVYEQLLYRTGQTRITFLFSDAFNEVSELTVGPIRSVRIGHVRLQQEWQAGIAFSGSPKAVGNNPLLMFKELGADEAGLVFCNETAKSKDYFNRVKGVQSPNNLNTDVVVLRSLIPSTTVATPHPFLFADLSPYLDGYDTAYTVHLDWGHSDHISSLEYDEAANVYLRYCGDVPYTSYASAEDRSAENMEQMSFSNVIIQRVEYEWVEGSSIMPELMNLGRGNADIFIGGRYIPGYWVRDNLEDPTVFFDDQGNEIVLTRGKTYIANFPKDAVLSYEK